MVDMRGMLPAFGIFAALVNTEIVAPITLESTYTGLMVL